MENKIEEIAKNYHDRSCGSYLYMNGQTCPCCNKKISSSISIEHDSQDFSKDLNVCSDCYSDIVKYWKENKPGKICPI